MKFLFILSAILCTIVSSNCPGSQCSEKIARLLTELGYEVKVADTHSYPCLEITLHTHDVPDWYTELDALFKQSDEEQRLHQDDVEKWQKINLDFNARRTNKWLQIQEIRGTQLLQQKEKLNGLLQMFYSDHRTSYEVMLTLKGPWETIILKSNGAGLLEDISFQDYENEMREFSIFLDNEYWKLLGDKAPLQRTKQQAWLDMAEYFTHITDGLGMPIDQKVKETVVVLNLLGIPTRQSCHGHLEHGLAHPWIDIQYETEESKVLDAECDQLLDQIAAGELAASSVAALKDQLEQKYDQLRSLGRGHYKPLWKLIHEFYNFHQCPYEQQLVVEEFIDGNLRLMSRGGYDQFGRPLQERTHRLSLYQREMQDFTEFLKDRFFNG